MQSRTIDASLSAAIVKAMRYRSTFAGLFGLRLERPTLFSPSNGVALSRVLHRENSQCDDAVD